MQVIRPSVAVKALYIWHISSKATFKGTSQYTWLSNLCLLSSLLFLKLPVFKKKSRTPLHGFRRDNENEDSRNVFVTCWLHEYTSTRRKSHLYEVCTKNFTISLRISLLITQSMSVELLRIFSSA